MPTLAIYEPQLLYMNQHLVYHTTPANITFPTALLPELRQPLQTMNIASLLLPFALMCSNLRSLEELRMRQQAVVVLKVSVGRGRQLITAALWRGALRS